MYSLLVLGCVSFVFSLLLTPAIRNSFRRRNLLDHPDTTRKYHEEAVPRVGGIAIVISFMLTFALLMIMPLEGGVVVQQTLPLFVRLVPSALLVFFVGLI